MGDSRYVVEPNLKEGKGGLRDLHTLFWIGKYAYQVETVAERVEKGLLTNIELRSSAAPKASFGRCASTCTISPDGRRSD